jgi:hypothetical protein
MSSAMTTPSKRTGIPSASVVVLLAVILFLGLALAPKTFEFDAWPEPTRQEAIEEVVDRPVSLATEGEVTGLRRATGAARRARAFARDGRPRERRTPETAGPRERARSGGSSGRGRAPGPAAPSARPAEVVEHVPAPDAPAPEQPAPEQNAQLAEIPPADTVLRPDVEEAAPEQPPVRAFEVEDEAGEVDVRGHEPHGRGHGRRRQGR